MFIGITLSDYIVAQLLRNARGNTGQNDGNKLVQRGENGYFHEKLLTFEMQICYTEFVRQAVWPAVFFVSPYGHLIRILIKIFKNQYKRRFDKIRYNIILFLNKMIKSFYCAA